MNEQLLHFTAPAWHWLAAIFLLAAAVVGGWVQWLRGRKALTTEHLYNGGAVVLVVAILLGVIGAMHDVHVNSYGAMLMLGFLAGTGTIMVLARRRGVPAERMIDLGLVILVGAIIGARVMFVLITPGEPMLNLEQLRRGLSGLSFHGGLLGGFLAGSAFLLINRLPYLRVVDAAGPAVLVGYAITRLGCFLNGCCFGRPSPDIPWHVFYPRTWHPSGIDLFKVHEVLGERGVHLGAMCDVPFHPSQLYASLIAFAGYGILLVLARGRSLGRAGRVFMAFLMLAGVERFVMEMYRWPDSKDTGLLTPAQFVSLALFLIGVVGFFLVPKKDAVDNPGDGRMFTPTVVGGIAGFLLGGVLGGLLFPWAPFAIEAGAVLGAVSGALVGAAVEGGVLRRVLRGGAAGFLLFLLGGGLVSLLTRAPGTLLRQLAPTTLACAALGLCLGLVGAYLLKRSKVEGQKAEVRSQRSEAGGQR